MSIPSSETEVTIYVGKIPFDKTEQEFRDQVKELLGRDVSHRIDWPDNNRRKKLFAFIHVDASHAERLVKALKDDLPQFCQIRINEAQRSI